MRFPATIVVGIATSEYFFSRSSPSSILLPVAASQRIGDELGNINTDERGSLQIIGGTYMVKKILPPENKTIFNASEACGYLGICWNTFKRLIEDGEIRATKLGRRYLIPKENIDNFLKCEGLIAKALLKSLTEK